ncbi:MAG: hypothetical protein ABI702_15995 [Burkholderiales bacterium]
MDAQSLRIHLSFSMDDQAWLRRSSITVPKFWHGHTVAPVVGDALRVGGRQFMVQGRVWEHDGATPVLRVFLSSGHAESDTVFG